MLGIIRNCYCFFNIFIFFILFVYTLTFDKYGYRNYNFKNNTKIKKTIFFHKNCELKQKFDKEIKCSINAD